MITIEQAEQVERLLGEGTLSQRTIAKTTGVSRGTVAAIAKGKRPDYDAMRRAREAEQVPEPIGPPQRCPGCGGMVLMPCVLCRVEELSAASGRRPAFPSSTAPDRCFALDLKPHHRRRYEEVRRQKEREMEAALAEEEALAEYDAELPDPDLDDLCDVMDFDDEPIEEELCPW